MRARTVDIFDVINGVGVVAQLLQYFALPRREIIAINKRIALRVVGGVDINQFDLPKIVLPQQAQGIQVVALDQQVIGSVPILAVGQQRLQDFLRRHKCAVVRLALAHPAQFVAVFFHGHAGVNGQL